MIYNPHAGQFRRRPTMLPVVLGALEALGEVRGVPTQGPLTAGSLARTEIDSGAKLIVALGGDGTINEIANGMIGSETPLAPLPGGTANVLCVETGLGTNPERAAQRLAECEPVRIAVGRMRRHDGFERHFLLMAGVGLDAMVLDSVSPELKAKLGKAAYWLSGFAVVGRDLPQFDAAVNGASTRRSFALASRVRNYGGDLEIAKNVTLLQPVFETVLFEGDSSSRYMAYLAAAVARCLDRVPGVAIAPALQMRCVPSNGDRVPVQLDGEAAGYLPAEFDVLPDALTLVIPSSYVQRARESRWTTSPTP